MAAGAGGGTMAAAPAGLALFAYDGSELAELAIEAAPTWKGIVETAAEHRAGLIVLGSHRRSGLVGHLLGSVAAAVAAHSPFPVLIVPGRS